MDEQLHLPVALLLLFASAGLFAKAWWGHWFYMAIFSGGAVVIVCAWLRTSLASPLNLLSASILLFYNSDLPGRLVPFLTLSRTQATYDSFLSFADRSFGFFPSILVYNWVSQVPHLDQFFFGVYMALSIAMGACFAAHIRQGQPPWKIALVLSVTATIGVLCYSLLPACGPLMLLGPHNFTHGDSFAAGTPPALVPLAAKYPRNAVPSLHMTWALLVLWISRDLKRGSWLAAIFACLTAIATLSTGEHYLLDLVVAFPFALAIWTLCIGNVPLAHPRRTLTFAGAVCAYLAWISAIRFSPALFYASPVIPWGASLATVAGTLYVIYSQPVIAFRNAVV